MAIQRLPRPRIAFGAAAEYAQLVRLCGDAPGPAGRYGPAACVGARKDRIEVNPDPAHVSTSYVERQSLTMRMGMRHFTRLTNGFSKKAQNHAHGVAVYFMHCDFVCLHRTLRCTPATAAGVTTKLWELADMVKMPADCEARQAKE